MADETVSRIGAMLEELGTRFDLVVEAVSGFGGRLDKLHDEVFGQFAEVGTQVRFLSDEIAENRSNLVAWRSDFGAEMVRLGETLGRTRVEFREQLASVEAALGREIAAEAEKTRGRIGEAAAAAEVSAGPESRQGSAPSAGQADREAARTIRELKREIAISAESAVKKLGAELKLANRALAALGRKFERFDDRITIQVRDQEQRLKKVEGRGRR